MLEVSDVALLRFLTRSGIEGHQEERCGVMWSKRTMWMLRGLKRPVCLEIVRVFDHFNAFWSVLARFGHFYRVLEAFIAFLGGFDVALWRLFSRCGGFWGLF